MAVACVILKHSTEGRQLGIQLIKKAEDTKINMQVIFGTRIIRKLTNVINQVQCTSFLGGNLCTFTEWKKANAEAVASRQKTTTSR